MLFAVALLAPFLLGCSPQGYRAMKVGQCLPSSADVVGEREQRPPTVPCSAPHRYEVYAVTSLDLDPKWPGDSAVDEAARQSCYDRFEAGTGKDPLELPDGVKVVSVAPTEDGWTTSQDRSVECLVALPADQSESFISVKRH